MTRQAWCALMAAMIVFAPQADAARARHRSRAPARPPLGYVAPAPEAGRPFAITYEGVLDLEGHFRRPGDTHRYHSRQRFQADGRGDLRLDWTTWEDGDTLLEPETFLRVGDRAYHRDGPRAAWQSLSGDERESAMLQVTAGMPWEFARDPRLVAGVEGRHNGARVLEATIAGRRRSLQFDRAGLPRALDDLRAHPRLGDVVDHVGWRYAHAALPESLIETLYQRDSNWSLAAVRVGYSTSRLADSLFTEPANATPARVDSDSLSTPPEFTALARGIWAADMPDLNTRSLVVEFADGLAVLECAVGSPNGERLVDAIKLRWPGKPIRYFLASHHHPHYMGGMRALVADGAAVITTTGNAAFVRDFVRRPFTLQPDRLARGPREVHLTTFTDRFELADSTNRLVAVNIGARSDHTDEFVVFWFPRARLLFETEQGWVDGGDGKVRASGRARGFLKVLDDEKLDTQTLVQSWPMRGLPRTMTRAELEALIPPAAR